LRHSMTKGDMFIYLFFT